MILASKDQWGIVDKSEEAPPFIVDVKDKTAYKKLVKTTFGIIAINLFDREMAHMKHCIKPTQV